LAGASLTGQVGWLIVSMSLFYVGGMYLNDAFDADIDALERPERPIPSGQVSRRTVYTVGFALLGLGELLLLWIGSGAEGLARWLPAVAGLALASTVILYNAHHKNNPLSPALMGACRMLVYITAGITIMVPLPALVWLGAILLFCYLIGLTYVAKQENLGTVKNLWPLVFLAAPVLFILFRGFTAGDAAGVDPSVVLLSAALSGWIIYAVSLVVSHKPGSIPRAVVSLIAGISLLDALMIASAGVPLLAAVAVCGFVLTLMFQRYVPGT